MSSLPTMKVFSEMSVAEQGTNVQSFLAECRELIDAELERMIPAETVAPQVVHQAIRWSVFAGGKRFRPALVLATGETFAAPRKLLLSSACALEMIHTYSLIHDDLPSMDDDDLRRGRPTCHVRFGEATAILAGDALQSLAFQTIAEDELISTGIRTRLISELSRSAGTPLGMVAGQAQDLEAESQQITSEGLDTIHRKKTGALIVAAARAGAIVAGANDDELDAVSEYASRLGLLFQITDDLLDVTASAEDLGKTPGKDARSMKATYASVYGVQAAHERARNVHDEACASLEQISRPTKLLYSIADFILHRSA